MSDYIVQNSALIPYVSGFKWLISQGVEILIQRKIHNHGIPISNWGITINYGIKTGANDAFIINSKTREELIRRDSKSAEIIRPILRGKDIQRYKSESSGLYLICLFPSKHYNIENYKAIKDYLISFGKERLEQTGLKHIINNQIVQSRKKTGNKWFETQDQIGYWDDFSKPKIFYREIGKNMDACFVKQECFVNNKCYVLTGPRLLFLLGIFNSSLFNKVMMKKANITGGKGYDFMKDIYIPKPSEAEIDLFEIIVKERDECKNSAIAKELDMKIDNKVFDYFNLDEKEREWINKY